MKYAQVKAGQQLHLVLEAGEEGYGIPMIPKGSFSRPLCNRPNVGRYRMTINVPLGAACKNCQKVFRSTL